MSHVLWFYVLHAFWVQVGPAPGATVQGTESVDHLSLDELQELLKESLVQAEIWQDQHRHEIDGDEAMRNKFGVSVEGDELNVDWKKLAQGHPDHKLSIKGSVVAAHKLVPLPNSALDVRLTEKLQVRFW